MSFLLDTQVLIWAGDSPERLPSRILRLVRSIRNAPLALSVFSVWEIAKKVSLGKLTLSCQVRDWVLQVTQSPDIQIMPLTPEIAIESCYLPDQFHRDPADQIIVATARVHNLTLVTSDQRILEYRHVKTIWE